MVSGSLGLFGGNLKTTSNLLKNQAKPATPSSSGTFANLLRSVKQPVVASQKTVAGGKPSSAAATKASAAAFVKPASTSPAAAVANATQVSSQPIVNGTGSGNGNNGGAAAAAISAASFVNAGISAGASLAAAATTTTASKPAAGPTAALSAAPANTGTQTPAVMVLTTALAAAGIDISQLQFNEHIDTETYPGGSYTQDLITMTGPGGITHTYSADLMLRSPQVTVTEIQHELFGWPR